MTEQFPVLNRFTGAVQFTATIECDPGTNPIVKLGLAVMWGQRAGAYLTGADLRGAYLRGADLRDANLTGADLRGANLTGAYLTGAYLRGANLTDANLTGANLTGANLRGADLRDANLTGAYLGGADLRGADLTGAYLTGAYLTGAYLRGEKIARIFASVTRQDGYTFLGFELAAGGYKIAAGCRWFTAAEYVAHATARGDGRANYPIEETLDILDFIATRAAKLGITAPEVSK